MADLRPQLKDCGLQTEDWRPETEDLGVNGNRPPTHGAPSSLRRPESLVLGPPSQVPRRFVSVPRSTVQTLTSPVHSLTQDTFQDGHEVEAGSPARGVVRCVEAGRVPPPSCRWARGVGRGQVTRAPRCRKAGWQSGAADFPLTTARYPCSELRQKPSLQHRDVVERDADGLEGSAHVVGELRQIEVCRDFDVGTGQTDVCRDNAGHTGEGGVDRPRGVNGEEVGEVQAHHRY